MGRIGAQDPILFSLNFLDEFENLMQHTTTHQHIPFDFNSSFIKLHFGSNKQRNVSYEEFTQILHVSVYVYVILISYTGKKRALNYVLLCVKILTNKNAFG